MGASASDRGNNDGCIIKEKIYCFLFFTSILKAMSKNNNTASYDIFKDWDKTFKRWFSGTYKTQLKNVHIGK